MIKNRNPLIYKFAEFLLPTTPHEKGGRQRKAIFDLWITPRWQIVAIVLAVALFITLLAWESTFMAGGTKTVYVHLAYLPILLIALFLGLGPTLLAAAVMTYLFGPIMPLDAETATPQATLSWLTRGGFFAGIGGFVALGTLIMKNHALRQRDALYCDQDSGLPTKPFFRDHVFPQLTDEAGLFLHVGSVNASAHVSTAFGQDAVDKMCKIVGQRLLDPALPEGDVFRITASKFGILERPETADAVRNSLKRMRLPVSLDGLALFPDTTIGTTALRIDQDPVSNIRQAISAAELAFERKRPFAIYSSNDEKRRRQQLGLLADLAEAINTEQLFLLFQPKVRLSDETVVGAEALIRWNHPEKGLLSPGLFIPVAERSPIMMDLTFDVIGRVFNQVNIWKQLGIDLAVSANISARDLSDDGFVARLGDLANEQDTLKNRQGKPLPVEIEVTESAAFSPDIDGLKVFAGLRDAGYRIAIDDYGTGQSSLSYLRNIPADYLKLDGMFVKNCASDNRDLAMVRSTVELAHDLGLETVAEGVEKAPEIETLRNLGCDYVQGYFYARPLSADAFVEFATSRNRLALKEFPAHTLRSSKG